MKVNTKVRYGLRAMVDLAGNLGNTGILQKEISERQLIPLKYLDSIISSLKSAGLIVNYAGKGHGYVLTRQPEHISVYDIYRAFEPDLTQTNCQCGDDECLKGDLCPDSDFWYFLNSEIKKIMSCSTLEQLIHGQEEIIFNNDQRIHR